MENRYLLWQKIDNFLFEKKWKLSTTYFSIHDKNLFLIENWNIFLQEDSNIIKCDVKRDSKYFLSNAKPHQQILLRQKWGTYVGIRSILTGVIFNADGSQKQGAPLGHRERLWHRLPSEQIFAEGKGTWPAQPTVMVFC